MRRYLVVANLTLGGKHLDERVRTCLKSGACTFQIVVPACPPPGSWTSNDESDVEAARARLDHALERFRALGAEAEGTIGDARPLDALKDALSQGDYDEIILSTLPPGASRWLGMDLISRVERAADIPVTHVVAEPEPALR